MYYLDSLYKYRITCLQRSLLVVPFPLYKYGVLSYSFSWFRCGPSLSIFSSICSFIYFWIMLVSLVDRILVPSRCLCIHAIRNDILIWFWKIPMAASELWGTFPFCYSWKWDFSRGKGADPEKTPCPGWRLLQGNLLD